MFDFLFIVYTFIFILPFIILIFAIFTLFVNSTFVSVFLFVATYFFSTFLLMVAGAEFLNFIILLVYVGAISVLFIFTVIALPSTSIFIKPISFWNLCILLLLFFAIILYSVDFSTSTNTSSVSDLKLISFDSDNLFYQKDFYRDSNVNNIEMIGSVLYTVYFWLFIGCGFMLLFAVLFVIRISEDE